MKALAKLGFEFRNRRHGFFAVQPPLSDAKQNKAHEFLLSQFWQISQTFKNPKEKGSRFVW